MRSNPRARPSRARELATGLALLAGTLLLIFLLGEATVRWLEPRSDHQRLYQGLKDSPRLWGLMANRTVLRDGVTVHTNSFGDRGDECPVDKPAGTFRIVGLGDSYTFGSGVRFEDTYLHVLETLLNQATGSDTLRHYQALNLGVEGYNTVQELASLREAGLRFHPDLILVGYVFNDVDAATAPGGESPLARAGVAGERRQGQPGGRSPGLTQLIISFKDHSRFFAFVSPRLGALLRKAGLRRTGLVGSYVGHYADGDRGWRASRDALLEIKALAQENGARLAVLVFPAFVSLRRADYPLLQYHQAVTDFCRASGIPVCDLYPAFEGQKASRFWMSLTDPHPNGAANHIAARAVYRFLTGERLVLVAGR